MGNNFEFVEGEFQGVKIIKPFYIEDNRGYFVKSYEKDIFVKAGINVEISEDFESFSKKNVIRGLHFQTRSPQTKIVRVIIGRIVDVLVDLRKQSDTFGQSMQVELSQDNHLGILIPAGIAHGFRVLSEDALVSYKCFGKYLKDFDTGILWNDKDLGIEWGIDNPILSDRDSKHMTFTQFLNIHGGL